jgi:hypothetical protein
VAASMAEVCIFLDCFPTLRAEHPVITLFILARIGSIRDEHPIIQNPSQSLVYVCFESLPYVDHSLGLLGLHKV